MFYGTIGQAQVRKMAAGGKPKDQGPVTPFVESMHNKSLSATMDKSRAPYYRDRARGLRDSAAETKFADIRRELQDVAKQFDRLADSAERRCAEPVDGATPRHWSDSD